MGKDRRKVTLSARDMDLARRMAGTFLVDPVMRARQQNSMAGRIAFGRWLEVPVTRNTDSSLPDYFNKYHVRTTAFDAHGRLIANQSDVDSMTLVSVRGDLTKCEYIIVGWATVEECRKRGVLKTYLRDRYGNKRPASWYLDSTLQHHEFPEKPEPKPITFPTLPIKLETHHIRRG